MDDEDDDITHLMSQQAESSKAIQQLISSLHGANSNSTTATTASSSNISGAVAPSSAPVAPPSATSAAASAPPSQPFAAPDPRTFTYVLWGGCLLPHATQRGLSAAYCRPSARAPPSLSPAPPPSPFSSAALFGTSLLGAGRSLGSCRAAALFGHPFDEAPSGTPLKLPTRGDDIIALADGGGIPGVTLLSVDYRRFEDTEGPDYMASEESKVTDRMGFGECEGAAGAGAIGAPYDTPVWLENGARKHVTIGEEGVLTPVFETEGLGLQYIAVHLPTFARGPSGPLMLQGGQGGLAGGGGSDDAGFGFREQGFGEGLGHQMCYLRLLEDCLPVGASYCEVYLHVDDSC